ncbi:anti sigma factor C-terminal domain-containing protein [Streptococcus himalayensis]|uniref:Sigma factor regulator C-terminal domain-containing protein n=1 Tax=Streptococcus himalayensis TaxID=1888195 RepID=A0A917AA34_9STRE|nr:anti sigma factor C-terminal domain-containing protein [Streptococcus himalayensis]GGE34279.1 hypothetical protein GCM10011510_14590 [Streptococcus himalayensis]
MKTFEIATKKSKRKTLLKTVGFSTVGTLTFLVGGYLLLNKITSENAWKMERFYEMKSSISYPNIQAIDWSFDASSQFSGTFRANQVKDIAGISVPFEPYTGNYSLSPRVVGGRQDMNLYQTKDGKASYTHGHSYKSPMFFNREYDYRKNKEYGSNLTQDIALLPQMTGKAVEVAVTFDKPYTFEEIASMIPETLKINWYWIGTSSSYNTGDLDVDDQIGFTPNLEQTQTKEELEREQQDFSKKNEKASTEEGEKRYQEHLKRLAEQDVVKRFENSYTTFYDNLQKVVAEDWQSTRTASDGSRFDLKADIESYLKNNPDGRKAKFAGLILTGKAEDFAPLEKANWIFGSNIGQSIALEPYHQLDTRHDPTLPQK